MYWYDDKRGQSLEEGAISKNSKKNVINFLFFFKKIYIDLNLVQMGKKFKLKPKKSLKFLSIKFFILVCPTAIFIIINILYKKKKY